MTNKQIEFHKNQKKLKILKWSWRGALILTLIFLIILVVLVVANSDSLVSYSVNNTSSINALSICMFLSLIGTIIAFYNYRKFKKKIGFKKG